MKKIGFFVFLFLSAITLSAQDYLAKNEYFYSLINGLDILVVQDSSAHEVSLGIAFHTGAFNKEKTYDGFTFIYQRIISERMKSAMPEFATDSVFRIHSEPFYEYIMVRLSFPGKHLDKVLESLYKSVSTEPFTASEIDDALAFSNSELQKRASDTLFSIEQKMETSLWEDDYQRRTVITAWNDSTARFVPARLQKLKSDYFCPRNGLLVAKSSMIQKSVYEKVKAAFLNWERCTTNPFTRFPAPNYRTALQSTQLVDENPLTQTPFFRVAFPGPNTFEDLKSNFCAMVLASLIESPESKINRLLTDSCHLFKASLHNDLAKFISQITFEFTPEAGHLADGYECFRSFILQKHDSVLDEQELALAKEHLISSFRSVQSKGDEHVSQIVKYWACVTVNDYSTFADSVNAITLSDMKKTFENYFLKRKYAAALSIEPGMRASSGIDSAFTPTSVSLNDYRINFLKNSAKLAGASNDSVLNSVIQYAKINPDVVIKVNGICHKDELLEITDKEMLQWVRSLEGFIMNPPSFISKKKFRLDVYRSLTIIRKMMEEGIEKKRLFGTGNLVRTPGEPEKYQYVHFKEVLVN